MAPNGLGVGGIHWVVVGSSLVTGRYLSPSEEMVAQVSYAGDGSNVPGDRQGGLEEVVVLGSADLEGQAGWPFDAFTFDVGESGGRELGDQFFGGVEAGTGEGYSTFPAVDRLVSRVASSKLVPRCRSSAEWPHRSWSGLDRRGCRQ